MAQRLSHPPTRADLEALHAGVKGEIIEGVMYTMTRPRARHENSIRGIRDGRLRFLLPRAARQDAVALIEIESGIARLRD